MFGKLFKNKNLVIDQFAYNLAAELFSRIQTEQAVDYFSPPDASNNLKKAEKARLKRDQVTQVFNEAILQVQQFKALHKLGVYGKARLHLTFTERLKELGYPTEVAAEINKTIMLRTP